MTRTIQILRGTEAQNDAFTGAVGELTMDTTNNEIRIHDGSTVGGHKIGGTIQNQNTAAGATNPIYDWVGTATEYEAQNVATLHPDWVCYITDDIGGPATVIAELAEGLNGKADVSALNTKTAHVVTEFQAPTAANNYTWYRKYVDGWVEQGGVTSGAPANVVLPVEMADTNYSIMGCSRQAASGSGWFSASVITTTGFSCNLQYGNGQQSSGTSIQWEVRGMAA